jgi:hypothetical protein
MLGEGKISKVSTGVDSNILSAPPPPQEYPHNPPNAVRKKMESVKMR